jgi:RecA-family ATPase
VREPIGASLNLQQLARLLGGTVSNGQVLAPGPGHSAADRSLSVKLDPTAPDGFLVHSFAGDDLIQCRDHVREKAGLPAWKPNGNGRKHDTDADIERAVVTAIMGQTGTARPSSVVARYDYTAEDGTLLYQVQRHEPKRFTQRRPDGKGGWIYQLGDVRRVPYRLPEILQSPDATVFICEGEKDADRTSSLDLCATTVASGKWTQDCVHALAGRDIIILEDADAPGRKKALATANALHGVAKTIRIVRLPGLTGEPFNKDVSDWLDADSRNARRLVDACFDVPIWNPENESQIEQKVETKTDVENTAENEIVTETAEVKGEPPPLAFINVTDWHDKPIPERPWAVRDRIPLNNVTLMSGEGSVGKTILSLQLGVAAVLARDWIGTMPEPGPVIAICCEDDIDELHRRLDAIRKHYRASFTDLADLHLMSLAGQDALMATPNRAGLIQPTKLFARVKDAATAIKPRLILLDNCADIFGGAENDRAQVRQFIGILRGLAMDAGAGVLLTSHPSLTGISTGTGLSGSTAWNASVRSRLYLKRATTAKDEEPDPDLRVLEVMKNNYGPIGETVTLRWKDGLFLPVAAPGSLEKLAREQKIDDLFLALLDRWIGQGRNVSDKKTANGYAPNRFAGEPEAKTEKATKQELAEAMERLFRAGKICVASYGLPSKGWTRIERK